MPPKLLKCTLDEDVNMENREDEAHVVQEGVQEGVTEESGDEAHVVQEGVTEESGDEAHVVQEGVTEETDGAPASDGAHATDEAPSVIELVQSFCIDLQATFPELEDTFAAVCALGSDVLESYIKKMFPPAFFDILYKNDKVFAKPVEFLPGVDFRYLWNRNISDGTRDSIWKHLQVLLFAVVSNVDDASSFGDAQAFFEAIDTTSFREKLEEVLGSVGDGAADGPQPEDVEEHLSGLLGGRIGRLAQQIAEEASAEFGDLDGDAGVQDVFSSLLGDPMKLMKLIKKIGSRIDEEIKSGALKESDLLKEATELLEKMRNTPGMEGMHDMMAKMGVSNERDMRVAQGRMGERLKTAKTRDRLREKLAQRRAATAAAAGEGGVGGVSESVVSSSPPVSETSKKKKRKKKKKPPRATLTDHGGGN